jgi:adenylate kinase family enzyme
VVREDDRPTAIRKRLEAYKQQTRVLLDYFEKQRILRHAIDASQGTPKEIATRIIRSLEEPGLPRS